MSGIRLNKGIGLMPNTIAINIDSLLSNNMDNNIRLGEKETDI